MLLPIIMGAVIVLHLKYIHQAGSSAATIAVDTKIQGFFTKLAPYFYLKDLYGLSLVMVIFLYMVTHTPDAMGIPLNADPANPLSTPRHIVPE